MKKSLPRRRTEDRERARQKILAAATHLFAERGLEDVTYGDIAKDSGLSRPLVYFYFPNQESLIQETFLTACQRLQERFVAAVSKASNGSESLMAIGRAYLQFHDDCPEEARLPIVLRLQIPLRASTRRIISRFSGGCKGSRCIGREFGNGPIIGAKTGHHCIGGVAG